MTMTIKLSIGFATECGAADLKLRFKDKHRSVASSWDPFVHLHNVMFGHPMEN